MQRIYILGSMFLYRSSLSLLCFISMLAACSKEGEVDKEVRVVSRGQPVEASASAAPETVAPEAPAPAPAVKEYRCTDDSDCWISCVTLNDCCAKPCACKNVYHADELAAIEAANEESCPADVTCPEVPCPEGEQELVAKCRDGVCVNAGLATE